MTVSFVELLLYAGGIFILFITPGPVWVAIVARTLSGGFNAAWPLALGVVVGDIIWPFLAILGVTWVVGTFSGFMIILRWVACLIFLVMGVSLIRNADREIHQNSHLTKPGVSAGFFAGLAVILSNPKAILFYLGILPGFFDLGQVSTLDIFAIIAISALIPFFGKLHFILDGDANSALIEITARLTQNTYLIRVSFDNCWDRYPIYIMQKSCC